MADNILGYIFIYQEHLQGIYGKITHVNKEEEFMNKLVLY